MAIMNFDTDAERFDGVAYASGTDPNRSDENDPSDKDDDDGPVAGEDEQDEEDTGRH